MYYILNQNHVFISHKRSGRENSHSGTDNKPWTGLDSDRTAQTDGLVVLVAVWPLWTTSIDSEIAEAG